MIRLLSYRADSLYPTQPGWIRALHELMEKYYKNETRDEVRIKALQVMADVVRSNRHMYEVDLLERVVLPYTRTLDAEKSPAVRLEAIKVKDF